MWRVHGRAWVCQGLCAEHLRNTLVAQPAQLERPANRYLQLGMSQVYALKLHCRCDTGILHTARYVYVYMHHGADTPSHLPCRCIGYAHEPCCRVA